MVSLEPLGDRAFLAHFANERGAASWAAAVRALRLTGVTDVVLAYRSAAVFADPDRVELEELETQLAAIEGGAREVAEGKLLEIPVLYDGPDLEPAGTVTRELALFKVAAEAQARSEILEFTQIYRGHVVDTTKRSVTIEVTGPSEKVDAFERIVRGYGLIEMMRTGEIAMSRGRTET